LDFAAFERLVRSLTTEIPASYLEGIAAIEVSKRCVPHPVHADVFTMGECVPVHGDTETTVSRIVLYYGSFRALERERSGFSWRDEVWETLTHELRHHIEWRADNESLERFDWAADQNFAREEGRPFDPTFFLSGERVAPHTYRIDDDVFIDVVVRRRPEAWTFTWHGVVYRCEVPAGSLPMFVAVDGLRRPPPGDAVLVFRRRPRLLDLIRRSPVPVGTRVHATPAA